MLKSYYNKIINYPIFVISFFILLLVGSIYQSKNFELDASADTLLIDNDPDLLYLRELNKKYKSEEFFIITYSPNNLDKKQSIQKLKGFVDDINNFTWVSKTISIINAPLLQSTNEPLMERIKNLTYITDSNVDIDTGLKELTSSPVYKNLIISEDSKTFGIVVYLKDNKPYLQALEAKTSILNQEPLNEKKLDNINQKLKILQKEQSQNISEYNSSIKNLIQKYNTDAEVRLSGIPMIADDMITFIKNDIVIFGIGVFLFIVLALWFIFRDLNWVILPLFNCFFSIIIMIGFLSTVGWKVTVISSNFIALMLILTMSMNIHYLVKYMQIDDDIIDVKTRVKETSIKIFNPIFFAVLTTICAFMSLITSEIKPVIDFGWMMSIGLFISLITTFLFLPAMILIFKPNVSKSLSINKSPLAKTFFKISKYTKSIYVFNVVIIILSIIGLSKLKVENSFINYFDKNTEIYKGMKNIDENLGGTTPLEIILKFKKNKIANDENDDFLGEEKKDDFLGESNSIQDESKYWFTRDKIERILNVHNYLEKQPEIGKVLSFASILNIAESLNDNKKLGSLEMGVLYDKLPQNIKEQIIRPYISIEDDEARITMRILDSKKDLKRKELINKINNDLKNKFGFNDNEFKLAGVLIIFNNLLQSLFDSQIKTLGFVLIGIFFMFLALFKSFKLSVIGIIPNIIASISILGLIGLLEIPLDMMTITIASITIGIAVDDTIHYIYKYKLEYEKNKTYESDKFNITSVCHDTVGTAIISTSITIIFGFSILVLSNFIPTIYFGLFTGLAMLSALILVLTLLPNLLNKFYIK